jgi:transposase InsO family protein
MARLRGRIAFERSHRIDAEEFYRLLEAVVIENVAGFNTKLREWENFYNYERPHGALGGISPYERLRDRAGLEG